MNWPSSEDRLLAACARLEFGEAERAVVAKLGKANGIGWERIYQTARIHGVVPLVFRNLTNLDPADISFSNGVGDRFRQGFIDNLMAKRHLRECLWNALRFFNERQLDVMLIKGAALELFVKGNGRYTVSRDVDLIIRDRRQQLTEDLLLELDGMTVGFPLEYDFYRHHDIDMNGALPIDWDRIWGDAIAVRHKGRDFFIMSPEDTLITDCINACRKRYFNLKALCAIDARLRDGPALRWDMLEEKSRAYQVSDIVYAALMVTARVMASPVPEDLAKCLGTTPARAAILEMLSKNLSFSSLSSLYSGIELVDRKVGPSLLLPYASYRSDQVWRKIRYVTFGSA